MRTIILCVCISVAIVQIANAQERSVALITMSSGNVELIRPGLNLGNDLVARKIFVNDLIRIKENSALRLFYAETEKSYLLKGPDEVRITLEHPESTYGKPYAESLDLKGAGITVSKSSVLYKSKQDISGVVVVRDLGGNIELDKDLSEDDMQTLRQLKSVCSDISKIMPKDDATAVILMLIGLADLGQYQTAERLAGDLRSMQKATLSVGYIRNEIKLKQGLKSDEN